MMTESTVYLIYPKNWFNLKKDSVIPCLLVAKRHVANELILPFSVSLKFKYNFELKEIKTSLMVNTKSGYISPEIIQTEMDLMRHDKENDYFYYKIDPSRNEFCEFLYPAEIQKAKEIEVEKISTKLQLEK